MFEDLYCELEGLGEPDKERNAGIRTFLAVPFSRRSKEHDAVMIAALLSDVV